jgi:hypothetical protein
VVKHEEAKRGFVLLPRRLCRGAGFRMGITISTAGEGLREAARRFGGSALCRLRLPLPQAGDRHPRRGFITRSRRSSTLRRSRTFHAGSPISILDPALRTASLILWSE